MRMHASSPAASGELAASNSASHRRSRGRPPGSKNKEKAQPIILSRENSNALRSHLFEIATGADIVASIVSYARRRRRGVALLSASGVVADISLRLPAGGGVVEGCDDVVLFQGRFEILSISGSFLPAATGVNVLVAGGQGQVVGGRVAGQLVASGPVMVLAATFRNAVYEMVPVKESPAAEASLEDMKEIMVKRGISVGCGEASPPALVEKKFPAIPLYNMPAPKFLFNEVFGGVWSAATAAAAAAGFKPPYPTN